jgi:N-acetylmuramic acid 6-phosphate etherase
MKSGTAQKLTLNTISTTAMILMGKTYGNLMIDLQARSAKLTARSQKMLIDLLQISSDDAATLLEKADGSVKVAIVCHRLGLSADESRAKLDQAQGHIRIALGFD